jgi:serine/threonine-protein phosphatase 6 regulatory subunit 3
MGHLTLIAEDVIVALERFPPDLRLKLIEYAPDPEWDDYVTGRYNETKKRDARLLGGGKPALSPGSIRGIGRWKVDEDDTVPSIDTATTANGHETKGEFRRAGGQRLTRESSADFGPPLPDDGDEDEEESNPAAPHVCLSLHSSV